MSPKWDAPAEDGSAAGGTLALRPLDQICALLLGLALLAGVGWGGGFATPPHLRTQPGAPEASALQLAGVGLCISLAAAAALVAAFRETKRPVAIGPIPGAAAAAILLVAWCAFSLSRSPAPYMTLNTLAVLVAAAISGGLASRLCRTEIGLTAGAAVLAVAGSAAAILGIREYADFWRQGIPYHRVFATFVNPDFLAGFLIITLPVTCGLFGALRERTARLGAGFGIALQAACLALTGSRAGVAVGALSMVLWAVAAAVSGATRANRSRILWAAALFLAAAVLASGPTRSRMQTSGPPPAPSAVAGSAGPATAQPAVQAPPAAQGGDSQGHSGAFRLYTWMGAVRMGVQNPVLGTGLGAFEVTYPRYAITAYTAHAHNSYLQLMGEAGIPALLFLLTAIAAISAFAARVMLLRRSAGPEQADASPPASVLEDPRYLFAGLIAALAATLAKNLIDSDWYIVATALAFGLLLGSLAGASRVLAPLAAQPAVRLSAGARLTICLLAVFVIWRAAATTAARAAEERVASAVAAGSLAESTSAFQSAIDADPLDPEPRLDLALLLESSHDTAGAEAALQGAARVARIGKCYYRLGQFYAREHQPARAVELFEQARYAEPHNLQNLKALADSLIALQRSPEAVSVYRSMTALQNSPYGKVRAVPELVETDFALAHLGIARSAYQQSRWREAASEANGAVEVYREFWDWFKRDTDISATTGAGKQSAISEGYSGALTTLADAREKLGDTRGALAARAELKQFEAWRQQQGAVQSGLAAP